MPPAYAISDFDIISNRKLRGRGAFLGLNQSESRISILEIQFQGKITISGEPIRIH